MKKHLKSLVICLGLIITNYLIGDIVSYIFFKLTGTKVDYDKYTYLIVFISDIILLILAHFILLKYNKKLFGKNTFKKIKITDAINIILFGFGSSVFFWIFSSILIILFPSNTDIADFSMYEYNFILQSLLPILLIPICEELLFRDIIFGYLRKNYNIVLAIIVQALLFGIYHLEIVQGIYATLFGIILALAYIYCNSLWGSIILHITFNLFGLGIVPIIGFSNIFIQYLVIIFGIISLVISILNILKKYDYELSK